MTSQDTPKGMIEAEKFAKQKGTTPDRVIEKIRDGSYVGQIIGDQWFIQLTPAENMSQYSTPNSVENILYRSNYETARKVSLFISFLGWLTFGLGIIVAFFGFVGGAQSSYGGSISIVGLVYGIGMVISGLFLVAAGQVVRATVDNADHTREILKHLKEQT